MEPWTPMQVRRHQLGLSLRELAEYTGMNRGTISLWERGRYVPTADEQSRLTGVLQDFELARGKRGLPAYLTDEERKQRAVARRMVTVAIRKGDLVRGECEMAGDGCRGRIVAHHRWGYDDPLRVVWLCGSHHGQEHADEHLRRGYEAREERWRERRELLDRAHTAYRGGTEE